MGSVIEVDFKNKKRIESYTKYDWNCASCHTNYIYDTRDESRVKRATIKSGKNIINICEHCIAAFHGQLGGIDAEV